MKKYGKILAIGLSCALAFSLVACGDDDKPKSTTPGPDPNSVKTEQVESSEQWTNAFYAITGTNVTCLRTDKFSAAGMSEQLYTLIKVDGDKSYWEDQDFDQESTSLNPPKVIEKNYYKNDGSVVLEYSYNSSTKEWETEETDNYPIIGEFAWELADYVEAYDDFEYNAAKNAYVLTDTENSYYDSVSVKIVDGKLSVFQMESVHSDGSMTSTMTTAYQFYDYGTTSVTLPKLPDEDNTPPTGTGVSSYTVTKAQWNAAIANEAFYNVTVLHTLIVDGPGSGTQTYKYDYLNGRALRSNGPISMVIALIDGGYHQFRSENGGEWVYEDVFDEEDDRLGVWLRQTSSNVNVFDYDEFTYADGQYTATNYRVNDTSTCDKVIMKFNGGKLIMCEYTLSMSGVEQTLRLNFFDYGTTTIDTSDLVVPSDDSRK